MVNVTTPPATGSSALLAVTVTASGSANPAPMSVSCGVLPARRRENEPLALERADVGIWRVEKLTTLVGNDSAQGRASAKAGLPGSRAQWLRADHRSSPAVPGPNRPGWSRQCHRCP